jgi:ADP-heptose:LPS heptosyltransferase
VEGNLAIARALGLAPPAGLAPWLVTDGEGEREAAGAAAAAGLDLDRPFVAVHPGAALPSKTWPAGRFRDVAWTLAADGLQVALVAPPGKPGVDFPPAPGLHALPPLSLPGLLALLARARLFVGNDSGPAHMAAAIGVPAVAVFGSQDPRVWRPWGPANRALWKGLPCSPCRGFVCRNPHRFECLDAIGVSEVVGAVRDILARTAPEPARGGDPAAHGADRR